MKPPKIESGRSTTFAFLVIAKDSPKYNFLKRIQKITWVRNFKDSAPVYYIHGNGKLGQGSKQIFVNELNPIETHISSPIEFLEVIQQNDTELKCDSLDGWEELLPNTLSALSYLQEKYNYDFVIRTNLSTYWNLQPTINLLKNSREILDFAGPIIDGNDIPLVPGYAMILSRTAIEKLLTNLDLIEKYVIDDVSISRAFSKLSTTPSNIEIPWVTVKNYISLLTPWWYRNSIRSNGIARLSDLDSVAAIRCREDRSFGPFNIRIDVIHFLFLHFRTRLFK